MCGIAGRINLHSDIINFNSSRMMIQLMIHRGPDEQNLLFIDTGTAEQQYITGLNSKAEDFGNLFLGHARLSIIDLNTGSQPMTDSTGKYTIVFNGEIYNYIEIRDELKKKGCSFYTSSDTEVILNAYKIYGPDCLKYLNGMFAFVIYDSNKDSLFCARDRLGIKPFYYYYDGDKFIFASEIKSILCHNDINRQIDYMGMADYLTLLYTTQCRTFFKKIKSLQPGFTLTLGKSGVVINRYWKPDLEPDYMMTERRAVEQLRYLIEDAVRIHMRSDVQIGAHLSGGVDSSAIASIVSKLYETELFTFTGKFNEGKLYDESVYALAVADEIRSKVFMITPTANDLVDHIAKIVWYLDIPVVGPGIFPQYMVSKIAGLKLKVVLGGQGGDELFLGYPKYIRTLIENKLLFSRGDHCINDYSWWQLARHYINNYRISGLAGWAVKRRLSDFAHRYVITSANLFGFEKFFTGELVNVIKHYSPVEEAAKRFDEIESSSLINKMSWYDVTNYLVGLLQVEDCASMAWSLESRVPLLDYRIVEFGFKIPSQIKLRGMQSKYIFKKAIDHVLPEAVKKRTDKKGFPTPVDIWFNRELAGFVNSFVTSRKLAKRDVYNSNKIKEFLPSNRKYLTPSLKREVILWPMINIELWFQLFIDGSGLNSVKTAESTRQVETIKHLSQP